MILGYIDILNYLKKVKGKVTGSIITDAKDRRYYRDYIYEVKNDFISIQRVDGFGDTILVPAKIELNESLVAFFGLYSGDGAKGSEDQNEQGRINPKISFSQKEKHLVRFAVDQFRCIFSNNIHFKFTLGEDSAYFMKVKAKNILILII